MHSNVTGLLDDLAILRKLANSVDERLIRVFPLDSFDNKRLFKLLRKAYFDARHAISRKIFLLKHTRYRLILLLLNIIYSRCFILAYYL